ncbi:hypothetical protein IJ750_07245 [bacterium]|nr:hypothetical protein [bacterium]
MPNNESVGKKIVEALKKQAENIETADESLFDSDSLSVSESANDDIFTDDNSDVFASPKEAQKSSNFFDDVEEEKDPFFVEPKPVHQAVSELNGESFEMPANIAVLKRLISQLPSGVSRHTGAQIIKQTMEALGISMRSVLQDAQQVQENLKVAARECQGSIQEYKKLILSLEKQSQSYQKQYSALNDLISLFIQTTK